MKRRRASSWSLDHANGDGELHAQPAGSEAIQARLEKLSSMIERLNKSKHPLDFTDRQFVAQNLRSESAHTDRMSECPPSPRRAAADSSGDEFPIPSGHATDPVDPVGSLTLGHLSLEDGGRSR